MYAPDAAQKLKEMLTEARRAFPDFHGMNVIRIAESDLVANRTVLHGTHLGEFQGLIPSRLEGERVGLGGQAAEAPPHLIPARKRQSTTTTTRKPVRLPRAPSYRWHSPGLGIKSRNPKKPPHQVRDHPADLKILDDAFASAAAVITCRRVLSAYLLDLLLVPTTACSP
jgi:hypothetical protein